MTTVRLGHLYPDTMNIYADRGNIAVFQKRLEWRGHDLVVTPIGVGDPVDPDAYDLIYMGGGQDDDQLVVAQDLAATKADALQAASASGVVQLYVCGGIQLAGHRYEAVDGSVMAGVGVLDLETTAGDTRLIGDLVIDATVDQQALQIVGYENHAGRTQLGSDTQPLGTVVNGHGNNGTDGTEGAVTNRVIGTYLHGPLLPKNPALADILLAWALERRMSTAVTLDPLDDAMELAAHSRAVAGANKRR